jgi:hypothetical protein
LKAAAMDKHLEKLVGQTEKYSTMLTKTWQDLRYLPLHRFFY